MEQIINIEGKDCRMVANALLPRQYRNKFGRDLIVDMRRLLGAMKLAQAAKKDPEELKKELLDNPDMMDEMDTRVTENMAWLMLRAGGEDVGETVEEWLGTIEDPMTTYNIMPEVLDLYFRSNKTMSKSKKK